MYHKPNRVLLFCLTFFLVCTSHAAPLTPAHEPKDDSFYVCYKKYRTHHSIQAPLSFFRKYQYLGCVITRQPCYTICSKKDHCPPNRLNLFGWFNTYPQALNAFYRCAYN